MARPLQSEWEEEIVTDMTGNQTAKPGASSSLLPQIIHAYMLVIHIALPALLYFLYGKGAFEPLTPAWATVQGDPMAWAMIAFSLGALVLAQIIPRLILNSARSGQSVGAALKLPGAGSGHPLSQVITPYIVRLSLFEMCTLGGFVLGMLRETPELSLPFAAVGLAGTLLSPPTQGFFDRFTST